MGFDQRIGNGKPKTGAAFGLFVRYERQKNFIRDRRRNAAAVVGDANIDHSVFDSQSRCNFNLPPVVINSMNGVDGNI